MDMCGTRLCLGSLAGEWEPGSLLGSLGMFFQLPGGWGPGDPVLISLSISAKKEQLSSNR